MIEGIFRTELDLLVGAIKHMRKIQHEQGPVAAQAFREQMEEYFRLPIEMSSSFVFDALVRLYETPAGTLKGRKAEDLVCLKQLRNGQIFAVNGENCYFAQHVYPDSSAGYFEYVTVREHQEMTRNGWPETKRTMTYDEAWSLMTEGDLTINHAKEG